jgi:hypothetical protein
MTRYFTGLSVTLRISAMSAFARDGRYVESTTSTPSSPTTTPVLLCGQASVALSCTMA